MSSYSCTYEECLTKKSAKSQTKEETFIPFRLLMCGHSICDLCVLQICKQQKPFIKCTVCSFNTTINETVQRTVTQNEAEIKRWLDSKAVTPPEVLRFDTTLFPLDFYQIGNGVHSGVLTATKTVEMIDLDLDDENPVFEPSITPTVVNTPFEDDSIVRNIETRIPRTAPEKFRETIEIGIKTFSDLSQNHMSIKRSTDETKEWFKKLRINARERFHEMHSILQNREKELMEEINGIETNRVEELRIFMNEILGTRSELKGKLLQSPQLQTDRDRTTLKKSIERIIKDANLMSIQSPQKEFKFQFEGSIEENIKKFGKIERNVSTLETDSIISNGVTTQDVNKTKSNEVPISLSSDEEEEEEIEISEISKENEKIDKEVVTILPSQSITPSKFYVQKSSDKERFDILNEELNNICSSPYYHSPAWDTLTPGESLFAYSLIKRCWCRATLINVRNEFNQNREPIYLADIVLIDYGMSETVQWYNIREKKSELFDHKKWAPFAYKCALHGLKPNRKYSNNWTQNAIDLFHRYIKDNQLVLIDFCTKDGIKLIDLIHYDVPEVTYQIPSVIEVMTKEETVSITENIDFNPYSRYKCQSLKYPLPEIPKTLKTMSVLVSHVESPDLFYVQLQRQHQNLLKLIEDLNNIYNESNVGIYTYYCPKVNTPCAALFDGDKKYYRALVLQKGKNASEFVVQFIDFGNKQNTHISNLRLLKDSFVELPIQAIPCGLIHVNPAFGFKWSEAATDGFKYAISNERGPQILTMCVYENRQFDQNMPKLMVVLRSYDGDNTVIKINELMVKKKLADSSGIHSQTDLATNSLYSSQESLHSQSSSSSVGGNRTSVNREIVYSTLKILKELVERDILQKSSKRQSLIKVNVCNIESPSEFYIQIDIPAVMEYFETQEKELHKMYSSQKSSFQGDIQFEENEFCAFRVNSSWRRGQVVRRLTPLVGAAPEEPKYIVNDLDYGLEKEIKVSLMRRLFDEFKKDGHFALKCKLHRLKPTGGDQWSHSSKDEFCDFIAKNKDLFILIKGNVETEPISVNLFSRQTIIPGAFSREKTIFQSINAIFRDKGFATNDRSGTSTTESDDDEEVNKEPQTDPQTDPKTKMPFSCYSSNESVLGSLQQRLTSDTVSHTVGQYFEYLKEGYPKEQTFYGFPTDLQITQKEFHISLRQWFEGALEQPTQTIEKNISEVLQRNGELAPFVGPYKPGAACTAYFDFDKTWNRAEIIGVTQTDNEKNYKMSVRFVDYGNQESMLVDKLSSQVFAKETPKLALKCQLINIKAINEDSDKQIRNFIYSHLLDNKCRFFWENYPNLPMRATVEIDENKSGEYKPFIEFLERFNLLVNRFEDNEMVNDLLNLNPLVNQIYGLFPIVFQTERFYEVTMSHYIGANYAFFQATELRQPEGNDGITINSEHDNFLSMLESLRSEIDENINAFPYIRNIREGQQCVAKYVDNLWYRGLITAVNQSQRKAEVLFVDHGNIDPIIFNNIREIPKKHLTPKAHAFICHITNIKPPNDLPWSRNLNLIEMMTNHLIDISADEKIFARFKNLEYPLKIDLYRCDPNNQTLPGKHVFQDFVDRGLLEFSDPRDVWRKPIEATKSYKSSLYVNVKTEPTDK